MINLKGKEFVSHLFENKHLLRYFAIAFGIIHILLLYIKNIRNPFLLCLFSIVPMILFSWEMTVIYYRFKANSKQLNRDFYNSIDGEDAGILFWIILLGHDPLASHFLVGFYLYTLAVLFVTALLMFVIISEFIAFKEITSTVIVCGIGLAFTLFTYKSAYVIHYGVPEIGHFLEKPQYRITLPMIVTDKDSNTKFEALADIYVINTVEEVYEEYGPDDSSINFYSERGMWIERIHFKFGKLVKIPDPVDLNEWGFVTDEFGKEWYVKLKQKKK